MSPFSWAVLFPQSLNIRSCSHLRLPQSSANVSHTPGLAQARPHDAMHLPRVDLHVRIHLKTIDIVSYKNLQPATQTVICLNWGGSPRVFTGKLVCIASSHLLLPSSLVFPLSSVHLVPRRWNCLEESLSITLAGQLWAEVGNRLAVWPAVCCMRKGCNVPLLCNHPLVHS